MTKISGKIRKEFLENGKIIKYTKYALGEIFLVMIGILLALQVNNWNERRLQRDLEINLLREMKENLLADRNDISNNVEEDSETLKSNQIILKNLESDIPYHDSLSKHFGRLQRSSVLVSNNSAFENLKSLGINIISNDSLRRSITDLYSARYEYIKTVHEGTGSRIIWENLNPILLENFKSKVVLSDSRPHNYTNLKDNKEFMEALRWHISIKEFIINLNSETLKRITTIIELIDTEMEDNS